MLVEALLAAPFPIVGIVMDYTYHRGTGEMMYADRLLEGAVSGARRAWNTPKAPYARKVLNLVKLAWHRPHRTYRVAWTAAETLRICHTRVTRQSVRAAVRAVKRQAWVKALGRFMLLEVIVATDEPIIMEAPVGQARPAPAPKPETDKPKRTRGRGRKNTNKKG